MRNGVARTTYRSPPYGLPYRIRVPARPYGSPAPEHRQKAGVGPDQHRPQRSLVEAPAGWLHTRHLHERHRAVLVPCQPAEVPVEVDVLADPDMLVVASDLLGNAFASELRRALNHPGEAAEDPADTQVEPDGEPPRCR